MAAKYVKDQPAGFSNRIERVAIVGAGGQVGEHLVRGLLATGKHTVTAISRENSNSVMPEGVKVAHVNYDDEASLVSAMKGQQVLIITMRLNAPVESQSKLIAAASKAGVPYVMPNAWGVDFQNDKLAVDSFAGSRIVQAVKEIEATGNMSWIAMSCSFWYEYSLCLGPEFYGFDFKNNKVTFYDDGKTAINTSTWELCATAIGKFFSLPELPQDENDTSPTVSQWKNRSLYISSFLVSQRDMLDSINRVTGKTDADWTFEYEPSKERYDAAVEKFKTDQSVFARLLYTRVFFPNGGGNFQETRGLANEALGLPKEDIDEATKRALKMAEEEYNPFTRT